MKVKPKFSWWVSEPVKRKVFYDMPEKKSPLLGLFTPLNKTYEDLLKLEKKAKRLWKKIKQARKDAR